MANVYDPGIRTLSKIGSILVHVDEGLGANGHPFDIEVLKSLMNDHASEWFRLMRGINHDQD